MLQNLLHLYSHLKIYCRQGIQDSNDLQHSFNLNEKRTGKNTKLRSLLRQLKIDNRIVISKLQEISKRIERRERTTVVVNETRVAANLRFLAH